MSVSKDRWAHTQDWNKNVKAGMCEPHRLKRGKEGSKERETEAPEKWKKSSKEQHEHTDRS